MTILNKILSEREHVTYATGTGTQMHRLLQRVVIDGDKCSGDAELVKKIKNTPELHKFFAPNSKTEVPIAGKLFDRFISRRIDRLVIDDESQTILVLDYKTDVNKRIFYNKYLNQIREYVALLHTLYPTYSVQSYILWTHDFSLEKLPI